MRLTEPAERQRERRQRLREKWDNIQKVDQKRKSYTEGKGNKTSPVTDVSVHSRDNG